MWKKVLRITIILALIAAIPVFWLNLDWFGIEPTTRFYVMGGGLSAVLLGVLYKLLGSFDLIPDWIPILGSLDDMFAWLLMAVGLGTAAVGFYLL